MTAGPPPPDPTERGRPTIEGRTEGLRVDEERLRPVLEATSIGTWEWEVGEEAMVWSENLGPMYGLARGGAPGSLAEYLELVHPDDRAMVEEAIRRAIEQGADYEIEFRAMGPDGETRWLHAPTHVFTDEGGGAVRLVGLTWDVTDRRRREEEARFLAEATEVLSSSLDPHGLLRHLARLAVSAVADWCVVHLVDPAGSVEGVAVAHRDDERERWGWDILRRFAFHPDASAGPARVLRTGKPELYEQVGEEVAAEAVRDPELGELLGKLGLTSAMVVPLAARQRVLGTITLATAESGRRYGERELAFAEELARRAGIAIDNAGLYRAEREARAALEAARQRLAFLAQVSDVLAASLDYERTLSELSELVVPRLADWCTINVVEEDGSIRRMAARHRDPDGQALLDRLVEEFPHDPQADSGVPRVIRSGRSELLEEVDPELLARTAHDEEYLRLTEELGIESCIVVPLEARGRTLGAISLVHSGSGRSYGSGDLVLAEDLGRRAGMAIDNARLFRDRDYIARTLQRSLLPPYLPTIPAAELASRYHSVGESVEVGGDFYDVFPLEPDTWGLVVGDVQGKGPDAAALVGLIRHTLRTAAVHGSRPARVLATLNAALLRGGSDRFCTVVLAFLERRPERLRIVLACGGHPPPLVIREDGSVEPVGDSGTLLGSFESPELIDASVQLEPGETMVFYTDGVVGGEGQDLPELGRFLEGRQEMSAETLADAVLAWAGHGSGEPRDDAALLVLRALAVDREQASGPLRSPVGRLLPGSHPPR